VFDYLKRIIAQEPVREKEVNIEPAGSSEVKSNENKIQVATAALYVEIASADGDFSEEEREKIVKAMKANFNLTDECVEDLISLSKEAVKKSISISEFTSVINNHFDKNEKLQLLKNLWRVVYTDGKLNQYEDRLIKIIGSTLNLDHKDVINEKLLVKQEFGE
jgi:uncharacterized tellurite resistance protein B-like protein